MNVRGPLFFAFLSMLSVAACKRDPAPSENAAQTTQALADDPKAACDARAKWTRADKKICNECLTRAVEEPCTCDALRGSCFQPRLHTKLEQDCDPRLRLCLSNCKPNDCACVDGCYAGHDACRAKMGAAEACIVKQCAKDCL